QVMEDERLIALIEDRTIDTDGTDTAPSHLVRFQFHNHLGSTSLELSDGAEIISYEEFYPYGGTSFQAVRSQTDTRKRYRHAGKERDEETGLDYYGARYFASWQARWLNCDPDSQLRTLNLYSFCDSS